MVRQERGEVMREFMENTICVVVVALVVFLSSAIVLKVSQMFYEKGNLVVGLIDLEMERMKLEHEKIMFEVDRRHICPDQKVYIKDNDQIKIIEYECTNHKNEADGKCRFCCIDEPTPNLNIINEICFDCEIYGAIHKNDA